MIPPVPTEADSGEIETEMTGGLDVTVTVARSILDGSAMLLALT